jgi:enoyl-CoA hydratase/carnithine racemase
MKYKDHQLNSPYMNVYELLSNLFQEIDLGLAADLGTLQRFPKVIGNDSYARELAFTARKFYADEAKQMGFIR